MGLYNFSFLTSRKKYFIAIFKKLTFKKIFNLFHCFFSYLFKLQTSGAVPPVVVLILTYKCNYQCIMCQKSSLDKNVYHQPLSMDYTVIKEFLKKYGDKITLLQLFGGEPLHHLDIHRVLDLIHDYNIAYTIGTNGSLLTPSITKKITGSCAWLSLSLDSANSHNYAKIRKGGDLKIIKNNLNYLHNHKKRSKTKYPIINGNATIFTYNLNDINQLIHFCIDHDIPSLSLSSGKLYNTKEVKKQHLIQNDKVKTKQVLEAAKDLASKLNFNLRVKMRSIYLGHRSEMQKEKGSKKRNLGLYFEVTIQPDFNTMAATYGYENMGIIEDNQLEKVWNSKDSEYAKIRRLN